MEHYRVIWKDACSALSVSYCADRWLEHRAKHRLDLAIPPFSILLCGSMVGTKLGIVPERRWPGFQYPIVRIDGWNCCRALDAKPLDSTFSILLCGSMVGTVEGSSFSIRSCSSFSILLCGSMVGTEAGNVLLPRPRNVFQYPIVRIDGWNVIVTSPLATSYLLSVSYCADRWLEPAKCIPIKLRERAFSILLCGSMVGTQQLRYGEPTK